MWQPVDPTSAAYFAARLEARRLEIWTDVPGLFSADPRFISAARLLTAVDYSEALEMAASGARVVSPNGSTLPVAPVPGPELSVPLSEEPPPPQPVTPSTPRTSMRFASPLAIRPDLTSVI